MPEGSVSHQSITSEQLNFILAGVNLKKVSLRPRYKINNASAA
jgi:hypothetical protein